ncbi:retron St85 family effector protein [Actinobacillus pleuropneumoniae]|uniref:retron St85 family effector protein n=1 Tax=Actinobacillus pleuropneumoniae TaxID=715 RepID=UPI003B0252CB
MDKAKDIFLETINPEKTQIKGKLPFIWVFGSGGDDIKRIEQIRDPLYPFHPEHIPYHRINSFRAKFIQWSKTSGHVISDRLVVPESYPNWLNFDKYSNLIDFELDISSISQGIIIFSESIGAYTEIGMFSCFTELHKNILILAQEKHINKSNTSFFNYGAIFKINENKISEELDNVWALDNSLDSKDKEYWDTLFCNISDHFLDIITDKGNGKMKFNIDNRHHIILLLLDLIDLFPNQTKTFYRKILIAFKINIDNGFLTKIINTLDILELLDTRKSGKNTYFSLKIKDYVSCLDYQADSPKKFERSAFKISMRNS